MEEQYASDIKRKQTKTNLSYCLEYVSIEMASHNIGIDPVLILLFFFYYERVQIYL